MSLNLQTIKRKLELKIQQGQEQQAMENVLLQKLQEDFDCSDYKEGEKLLKQKLSKRNELEELYQEKYDKLEKELNDSGLLED